MPIDVSEGLPIRMSMAPPPPPGARVLVVDDDADCRRLLGAMLASIGCLVVFAGDGVEALAAFAGAPFDLVLLDVSMPRMDGFEACRRLRAMPGGDAVPIAFVTAIGDARAQQRALEAGGDELVSKPLARAELVRRVGALLGVQSLRGELRAVFDLVRAQRDALLRLQRSREELAGFAVHDLKNALAGVMSNLSFAAGQPGLPPAVHEALGDALVAGESMRRLVAALLDIRRGAEGRLVPAVSEVPLGRVVGEVRGAMRCRAADRGVDLSAAVEPETGTVRADPDLLRRVLENFVDNAIRHAPAGSAVRIEARVQTDGSAEMAVCDEGDGVPPSVRDRVFDAWVTGKAPTDRGGWGLGLSFCQMAVEAHGGQVWVEDNEPRGSRFCVSLPPPGESDEPRARRVRAQEVSGHHPKAPARRTG